jgi:hypothetical protein
MARRFSGSLAVLLGFALAVTTVLASQPSEPEDVYRSYLSAFKAIKSLDDRSFEIFLSKAAQLKLAEYREHPGKRNCDPCPSPQQELEMAKAMRPFPGASIRPVRRDSDGIVSLTYKWREPPGSPRGIGTEGTDVTVMVELVQEQGWKLKHESWVLTEAPGTMTVKGTSKWSY